MIKNPYLAQAENLSTDLRSQNILKKAKSFGISIYENKVLQKSFFELKSKVKNHKKVFELFNFLLECEKNVQMSKED